MRRDLQRYTKERGGVKVNMQMRGSRGHRRMGDHVWNTQRVKKRTGRACAEIKSHAVRSRILISSIRKVSENSAKASTGTNQGPKCCFLLDKYRGKMQKSFALMILPS
eukprot:6177682-Pleurochrysis_carterae.AAC.2